MNQNMTFFERDTCSVGGSLGESSPAAILIFLYLQPPYTYLRRNADYAATKHADYHQVSPKESTPALRGKQAAFWLREPVNSDANARVIRRYFTRHSALI